MKPKTELALWIAGVVVAAAGLIWVFIDYRMDVARSLRTLDELAAQRANHEKEMEALRPTIGTRAER